MDEKKNKIIWVIGGSSGLGLACLNAIAKAGYTVVAGARSFSNNTIESNVYKFNLDVNNNNSIDEFVKNALSISTNIYALVYSAGIIVFGPCELLSDNEYKQVINTNFIGLTSIIPRVLPYLKKNNYGKILVFSSINGLLATPFQSPYIASKHAIEGYCECLSQELHNYKIDICIIEPGDHKSGSIKYRNNGNFNITNSEYNSDFNKTINKVLSDEENGSNPDVLGLEIVKLLSKKHLPLRKLIASPVEKLAVLLHRLLPYKIFKLIITKYYLG